LSVELNQAPSLSTATNTFTCIIYVRYSY